MLPDHYQALGVQPRASREEIRAAYLRIMRAHHPDRRPGDLASELTARRANAAWEVLRDRERRAAYDRRRAPAHGATAARPMPGPRGAHRTPAYGPAYSVEGRRYRQAFLRASLKLAAAVLVVGFVLLSLAAS